jgi:membrane fusion protein, copper/silver efflux system
MTPTRIVFPLAVLALGVALGWAGARWRGASHPTETAAAASAPVERKVLYWYDPMVPTQRFDKPGKSPFMDMQLVPRHADEADAGASGVAISPQAQQALGLRLARVERRAVGVAVAAVGTVQLNDREVSIVQSRTAGFVERVYARAPGDVVAAGAPLVDLLNPEWLGAQQEYLAVKATNDAALVAAARQRLALLGMPAALLERVERSGQPVALQTITAPIGGVITELTVRTGMTVAPGITLARINGLATVWLEAALPEALAAVVRPGQAVEARFPALPGEVVKGRVAVVLPEASRETRTLRVRIELPNPGQRLKAGLFAQVNLHSAPREALVVPAEAVIRTGKRTLVYVSEAPGRYRPVEVEIGEQADDLIVVRGGLTDGQQVVASGQFLVDSEASLQGVLARAAVSATGTASAAAAAAPAGIAEYRARGVVIEVTADSITLEHEPVRALKWPAMTMPFKLVDRSLVKGLRKGQALAFSFSKQGDDYVLTQAAPASAATGTPR